MKLNKEAQAETEGTTVSRLDQPFSYTIDTEKSI